MIINHIERAEFNLDEIKKGTLIYARHKSWNEGISGIVTRAIESQITVLFPHEKTNTQNHFFIPAVEVETDQWEIRYSNDGLQTVHAYGEDSNES